MRVLMVEDVAIDAELEIRELKRAGIRIEYKVVETEATFREALRNFAPELIISDFSMPHFDGMWALALARELAPAVPFIFVSGTIGEEYAIRALKNGAADYVLKNNLVRLPAAVERVVQQEAERTARRTTEIELEQTRNRLDGIVASLSDVVWSASLSPRRLLFANRAFETVWDLPVAEIYKDPARWLESIHSEDRKRVDNIWIGASRGEPFDAKYRIVRRDGAVRWIHDRAEPIRDVAGTVQRLDGIARDITDAMLQEERIKRLSRIQAVLIGIGSAIAHARNRQELLNEACRIAVEHGGLVLAWVGMLDHTTLTITPTACAGVDAESYLSRVHATARQDVPGGQGVIGRALREKRAVVSNDLVHELNITADRRQDAVRRGCRSTIALPLLVDGEVVGNFSLFAGEQNFFNADELALLNQMASEISFALNLMQKREALADSEKRFESILGTLQEVVWSMDPASGRVLYVNAAVRQLTRRPVSDFIVKPRLWRSMVHRDDRMAVRSDIRKLLQQGKLVHEFRIVLADGEERTVESNARVRRDDNGKAIRIDGTISDITERKKAELALLQLNEALESKVIARTVDLQRARHEAEEANHAKSSFLAAMSHEIRTPMNGVVGMIDVLHQSSLKGDQVEMVELIRESAFSLLGIINDILDFSKIEAGKLELEHEPVAVADVVEGVCGMLNGMAQKKDVTLTLYTDPAIPARVTGDALRLRQVLVNLANNAIKFSSGQDSAGSVAVRALLVDESPERVMLEFQITDNGIGMDEGTQSRLFTAFTQADVTTTRRFGGTGLGLAIASNLVQLMDGAITVESAPGKGSTFKVRVPFVPTTCDGIAVDANADVEGLSCLVVGRPGGLADDFAVYLEYDNAVVQRAPNLMVARMHSTDRSGLSVWVIDSDDGREAAQNIRATALSLIDQNVRFVVVIVERGTRRQPRVAAPNMITVDGNALTRHTFLKAVAAAAGRASLDIETAMPNDESLAVVAPSRAEALRQGKLILIAEDNQTNQKVIVRQLALLGYAADIAADGREAIERWQSGGYALLLTDLHMPNMDGYELTQAIRSKEKEGVRLPIVALTANALKGEADHCRAIGMDDYRSKPTPLAELKSVLEKWLPVAPARTEPRVGSPSPTSAAPLAEMADPVDVSVLKGFVGEDTVMVQEFLQDFRASAAKIALELRAACSAGQTKDAAAAAHKLKSSALSVGAFALGKLCAEMEEKGQSGERDALPALLSLFETEMTAVERFLDELGTQRVEITAKGKESKRAESIGMK
jgi:PAS domain S-box-containing protein